MKSAENLLTTIEPWLSVQDGAAAVTFYKEAFGAKELYRLDTSDGGVVSQLAVGGAGFWLSGESSNANNPKANSGGSIKMILTVKDPDRVFANALKAGASEVFPVGEGHGWRLGRLEDPFGHHWEIGHPLTVR